MERLTYSQNQRQETNFGKAVVEVVIAILVVVGLLIIGNVVLGLD